MKLLAAILSTVIFLADNKKPDVLGIFVCHPNIRQLFNRTSLGNLTQNSVVVDLSVGRVQDYSSDTLVFKSDTSSNINPKERSIKLDEIQVVGKKISPLDKLNKDKKEYRSIYLKGDKSHIVQQSTFGVSVSINRLFSALSKEGKDARKLQNILENEYNDEIVNNRFDSLLVHEITQLSGEKLSDFILQYRPSYEWIKDVSDYDLVLYIKEKFKEFKLK